MKQLLNSAWGIAGLCAIGIALVAWRIVVPLVGTTDEGFDAALVSVEDDWLDADISIEAVRHTLTAVDATALTWESTPFRDPFTPGRVISDTDLAGVKVERPVSARRLTLDALVAGSQSKFAVIDGEVVVKGDRVSDYLITDITARGVRLLHESDGTNSLITVSER